MIEIIPKLWLGNDFDCPDHDGALVYGKGWYIIHAEKDSCHRRAVGYTSKALDRNDPRYLWYEVPGHLYLNLIDAPSSDFIPAKLMDHALQVMHEQVTQGKNVLVHCNQGTSRSPALAMLYLNLHTDLVDHQDVRKAMEQFTEMYPDFAPGRGIEGYLRITWAIEQENR